MFTNEQRQKLNTLSKAVNGTESWWKKSYDSGKLDVVVGQEDAEDTVDYVKKPSVNGKNGQYFRYETAVAKGLISGTEVSVNQVVKKDVRRKPTFDEMVSSFETALDVLKLSKLPDYELNQVLAHRFVNNTNVLAEGMSLVDYDKEECKKLIELIPEGKRAEIQKLCQNESGVQLDAFKFVQNCLLAINHPDKSNEMYQSSLNSVDPTPRNSGVPRFGVSLASVVVPQGKKDRVKNKMAKESRRKNRRK